MFEVSRTTCSLHKEAVASYLMQFCLLKQDKRSTVWNLYCFRIPLFGFACMQVQSQKLYLRLVHFVLHDY